MSSKGLKVSAPAPAEAPAPEAPAEAPAAEAPPAAPEAEAADEEPESSENSVTHHLKALLAENVAELARVKKRSLFLKQLIKAHDSELKSFKSSKKVKRASNPDRLPSGIAKPVTVSDEMYTFLKPYGYKHGSLVSRTDVLKHVNAHIKQHDLQNPDERKTFRLDATLEPLFAENPEGLYTYTKIMAHTKGHFNKSAPGKSVEL